MESLPNSILYMIDSLKFQKLGRQAFAEYISKEMTPNQVMNNIIFNEDMYEDDVKILEENLKNCCPDMILLQNNITNQKEKRNQTKMMNMTKF
jgi:hypothetical protein